MRREAILAALALRYLREHPASVAIVSREETKESNLWVQALPAWRYDAEQWVVALEPSQRRDGLYGIVRSLKDPEPR